MGDHTRCDAHDDVICEICGHNTPKRSDDIRLDLCTPGERAVLNAMWAIPDGTLAEVTSVVCIKFSDTIMNALRTEMKRRKEQR